jgi:hypothetical protein
MTWPDALLSLDLLIWLAIIVLVGLLGVETLEGSDIGLSGGNSLPGRGTAAVIG